MNVLSKKLLPLCHQLPNYSRSLKFWVDYKMSKCLGGDWEPICKSPYTN
jgi:hypothetical protein